VSTLCKEMDLHACINTQPLQTVFFGGGTPSLIPLEPLERILTCIDKNFGIAADAEVSMEADPGTFDVALLRSYMTLGVNRFSVGIQAFDQVCGCYAQSEGCDFSLVASDHNRAVLADTLHISISGRHGFPMSAGTQSQLRAVFTSSTGFEHFLGLGASRF
jgi:hypothetical protein